MTSKNEIKQTIWKILNRIAPEADMNTILPDVNLRDQLDIDSMDLLNFMIGLHKEFGVDIPEANYPKLTTLTGCIDYLSKRIDLL